MADSLIAAAVAAALSYNQVVPPSCVCFAGHCPSMLLPNLPQECIIFMATTASSELFLTKDDMCMHRVYLSV